MQLESEKIAKKKWGTLILGACGHVPQKDAYGNTDKLRINYYFL